jgi:patatin-like phospholipase/acyl hydrolase
VSKHRIDGGGARGLSELIILKELMERIALKNKLTETPRPCEYFDMVGGTATGGCVVLYRTIVTGANNKWA